MLLTVLAAVQFTHIMDFMIMMPLGPQFMRAFGISPTQFGILVGIYSFSAGAMGFLAGFVMDKFNRKHALLFFYGGFVVGTLCCALSPNYLMLLISRAVAGGFGGVSGSVVLAIVGDVFAFERRGRAMGVIMTAFSLASILGVPAGLEFALRYDWHMPFLVLVGLGLVIIAVGGATMPKLPPHGHASAHDAWEQMRAILFHPNHHRAFALMATLTAGGALIYPYLAPSMVTNVGMSETSLKYIYIFGGAATLITAPYFGRLADRVGKMPVFTTLILLSLLPTLAIANLTPVPVWLVLVITTSYMIFTSGRFVPAMALITASVEPRLRGGFMSVNSAVQQLAAGGATFVAALLVHDDAQGRLVGFTWAGWLAVAMVFLAVWIVRHLRVVASASPNDAPAVEPVPESVG
ncbi:MAG TPA: MFS transporter [Candidatus Didemnitutus sp.]|nr:MFS transporter [Candidatus Didemnitutus sp.]